MAISLNALRETYFLRDHDPDFATGRRTQLVYAVESVSICFTHLNPDGPEPLTYLEYAKRDIAEGSQRGAINALGNAKRAVHLIVDKLLEVYALGAWQKEHFPARVELLGQLGAFPVRMVSALNRQRNLMEHEYDYVEIDQVADFVELVEMFITLTYPFFKRGVIGAFVGLSGTEECLEWHIDHSSRNILVREVPVQTFLDLPIGRVHYNLERPKGGVSRTVVPLERSSQSDWCLYLDVFVYCTRRKALRLPQPDDREPGSYYSISTQHFMDLEDSSDRHD